jgi:hypothetical protein
MKMYQEPPKDEDTVTAYMLFACAVLMIFLGALQKDEFRVFIESLIYK